ncbi:MAG: PAS domain S-box protein, partial [Desulfatirhabdiaceae bacterium]|nr:PAS domain S-box protein [Desulfatirhabdiaceae bacterium]
MKKKNDRSVDAAPLPSSPFSRSPVAHSGQALRRQAEEIVRKKGKMSTENLNALSLKEIRQTLHELQVHQIELEMQNEELRSSQEELDAARARYFDLYDLAPVGYLTVSEKARILEANLTAAALLGLTRDTLDKQPISRFIHNEDQDIYYLHRKQLFETGELQTCELRLMKKDGTAFWASLSATVEQAADGAPVYRVVISDITVRKLAEAYREMGREILQILNEPGELQESIRRALSALKTRTGLDAVGIRLQDGDDFPYFVQEGFANDFLLTENTLIERNADGGVCRDKDGKVSLQCTCGLVISGKADPSNPLFTAGGSCWTSDSFPFLDIPPGEDLRLHPRNLCIHRGYASVALLPIRDMDRIVGLLQLNDRRKGCFTLETVELLEGIASHIGAALMRKRTEEALRETQAILKAAMDNSQVGIAIGDAPSGALRYVNDSGLLIRGGDRQRVVNGVGIDQYVASWQLLNLDGSPMKTDEVPLARAIMFGETSSREVIIRRTIDDDRIVLANAAPIMDENGKVVAGVVAFMDITERKKLEQALLKAHEELELQVKERTAELVVAMKEVEKGKNKAETALSEIKKLKNQLEAERAYLQEEIKLENN